DELLRRASAVGVDGVQVAVAAVPGASLVPRRSGFRRRVRLERGAVRAEGEGDVDAVVQPLRRDGVGPEDDVPPAGFDRTGEVAGRGLGRADREAVAET